MQDVVLASRFLARIDGHRAARIDNDNPARFMRLVRHDLLFLLETFAAQVRDPVIEEIVCLGLQCIGADRDDRVGQFGILVAVVQLADAHIAGTVDFRVIGRAVVDTDVLDLHGLEIELARAPGVFVAASGAAMIEGRNDQSVLTLLLDDLRRHAGNKIERIVPARRLHLSVAPDEGSVRRCCWVLRASEKLVSAILAPRTEPRPEFTTHSWSGLMTT